MPVIQVRAREFSTGAQVLANYREVRAYMRGLTPPANVHILAPPTAPSPSTCLSDDEYAQLLNAWLPKQAPAVSVFGRDVCAMAARIFGLRLEYMMGKTHRNEAVIARQAAMYVCVYGLRFSFPKTGRVLGGRDHTTVIYGVRRAAARIAHDEEYAANVSALMQFCGC
jgi:hypothetical protein